MLIVFMGALTALNLIIWKIKFSNGRYGDLALDFLSLAILTTFFGHTLGGLIISVTAGTLISFYLLVFPPEFA